MPNPKRQLGREATLRAFETRRASFVDTFATAPDDALAYRAPGEEYALSGLLEHVAGVLRHYAAVLDAVVAADFTTIRVSDGGEDQDMSLIRAGFAPAERSAQIERLAQAHDGLVRRVERLPAADFERTAPVLYGTATEPSPTSAAAIVGWVDGHYDEHTQHIAGLLERARTERP
jgi:hypothetical protein